MCGQPVNGRVPFCGHCGYELRQGNPAVAAQEPPGETAGTVAAESDMGGIDPDLERTTRRLAAQPVVPVAPVVQPAPQPVSTSKPPAGAPPGPLTHVMPSPVPAAVPPPPAPPFASPPPQFPATGTTPYQTPYPPQYPPQYPAQYPPQYPAGYSGPYSPTPRQPAARLVAAIPNEILIVVAALAVMGVYTLYEGLRPIPDIAKALSNPYFGRLAWVILLLLLVIAAFGAACLAVALLLYRGDRVGRGLAIALAVALAIGAISGSGANTTTGGSSNGGWRAVILIGAAVACALLGLPRSVREFFAQSRVRDGDRPTAVVVAQVLLAVNAALVGLIGLIYLLLGKFDSKYYVVGLLMVLLAVGFVVAYKLVGSRERSAPIVAAIASIVTIILQLVGGAHSLGFFIGIGLDATIIAALWLNKEAVTFFGRQPTWLSQTGA